MHSKDSNEPRFLLTTEEKHEIVILAAGTLEGTDDEKLAAAMAVLAKAGQKHNEREGLGADVVLYYNAVGGSHEVLVRSVRPCREDPAIRPFLEYLSKSLLETPSDA